MIMCLLNCGGPSSIRSNCASTQSPTRPCHSACIVVVHLTQSRIHRNTYAEDKHQVHCGEGCFKLYDQLGDAQLSIASLEPFFCLFPGALAAPQASMKRGGFSLIRRGCGSLRRLKVAKASRIDRLLQHSFEKKPLPVSAAAWRVWK